MNIKPITHTYGPSKKIPRIGARATHERRKFQIDDTGYVTTGYNLNTIEVYCRPIGGIVIGLFTEKWKTTDAELKAWRAREHRDPLNATQP